MLENLHIKNVALIEESEIQFGKGLNILSGETGAGKSMVIDSINFVLGERTSRDFLRKGTQSAQVEALFMMKEKEFCSLLVENGIIPEEDGAVLITRTIYASGKSVCRVNGTIVTTGMLKQLSESLIDIHGQHEHQSLLNPAKHGSILDRFCGEKAVQIKEILAQQYKNYKELQKSIEELSADERQRAHKIDLLQFQIEEIENAGLKSKEEEALTERKKVLVNVEKIQRFVRSSLEALYHGRQEQPSASDLMAEAVTSVRELSFIDESVNPVWETLESVSVQLEDVIRELQKYAGAMEDDPEELNEIEERLQQIYHLKRKYGNTIDEILCYCEKIKKELEFISSSEEILQKLMEKKESLQKELEHLCQGLSGIRKEKAVEIQKEIENQLWDLEMKNARFEISIKQKQDFSADGWDMVEFMIAPNRGEEIKPLAKIASGGEMSRVMLAMKTVLAKADTIETFIFDEIDTGVSGRTAQKVAEKMSGISGQHQIICITHLPQIAAMADCHYLIEKSADESKTTTRVYDLDRKASVNEIARLMGGAKITQTTWQAAEELKEMADQIKCK